MSAQNYLTGVFIMTIAAFIIGVLAYHILQFFEDKAKDKTDNNGKQPD